MARVTPLLVRAFYWIAVLYFSLMPACVVIKETKMGIGKWRMCGSPLWFFPKKESKRERAGLNGGRWERMREKRENMGPSTRTGDGMHVCARPFPHTGAELLVTRRSNVTHVGACAGPFVLLFFLVSVARCAVMLWQKTSRARKKERAVKAKGKRTALSFSLNGFPVSFLVLSHHSLFSSFSRLRLFLAGYK